MKHHILLCVLIGVTACKTRSPRAAKVSEAPDPMNVPETLGIEGHVTWDQIKSATKGEIEHPWSDSYWPLMQKGMANRWNTDATLTKISESPATLYEQFQELKAIEDANQPADLALLSPGEKYDLLVSSTANVPLGTLKKLEERQSEYDKTYRSKVQDFEDRKQIANDEYNAVWKKAEQMRESWAGLNAQLNKAAAEKNATLIVDLKAKIDSAEKGLREADARLETLDSDLGKLEMDRRIATADFSRAQVELAKEMRPHLPMLAEGWQVWAGYDQSDIENISWMGHCHGWAPAALVKKRPKHAVMVNHKGKKILFTEGDIRALITKIWSHQAPDSSSFFGARRCNATRVDYDEIGRVLDGSICYGKKSGSCDKDSGKVLYVKNNLIEKGLVTFTEERVSRKEKVAVLVEELEDENYSMKVFESMTAFKAFQEKKEDKSKPAVMKLTVGCRDVNPMTLHLALVKLLRGKKTGFVLDVTRSAEVWNQPVYKYETTYMPMQLKQVATDGGRVVKAGELADINLVDDPFKAYRAEGTKYLVHLQSKIWYGMENGPMVDFDKTTGKPDDDNATLTLAYTLEFDANKKLIGGEWGPVPFSADENGSAGSTGDEPPDFIWYYPNGSKATAGEFREDIIDKIHKCSLAKAAGKTKVREIVWSDDPAAKPTVKEVQVSYSNCKI